MTTRSAPRAARTARAVPRRLAAMLAGALVAATTASGAVALVAGAGHAGPQGDGTALTPNGWKVMPAGRQVGLGERPYGLARSPDGATLLISNDGVDQQSLMVVDAASGTVRQTLSYPAPEALFLGVAYSPTGSTPTRRPARTTRSAPTTSAGTGSSPRSRRSPCPRSMRPGPTSTRSRPGSRSRPTVRRCTPPTTSPTPCPSSTSRPAASGAWR